MAHYLIEGIVCAASPCNSDEHRMRGGRRGVCLTGGCPSIAGHVTSMYRINHPLYLLPSYFLHLCSEQQRSNELMDNVWIIFINIYFNAFWR